MDQTFILALLSGPAVLLLDKLRIYLLDKWKASREDVLKTDQQDAEQDLATNEQALKIYKDIISTLKIDNERVNNLYIETTRQNINLALQVASLNERVHQLESTLQKQEADCQAKLALMQSEIESLKK